MQSNPDTYAALRLPEVRRLILATLFYGLAGRALVVAIGFQVFEISGDPLALGILGAVEAIPSVGLALFGGHLADKFDRRTIVLVTGAVTVLCALSFATLSLVYAKPPLVALYAIIFVAGIASGFSRPAGSALEAQVVPREVFINAAAWNSSVGQTVAIAGPAAAGYALARGGPAWTYLGAAFLAVGGWLCMIGIRSRGAVPREGEEVSIWVSIREGLSFVRRHQPLYGSMALDLFAVFFGGAMALLPAFAKDILKVGPEGLGWLYAAPSLGALLVMLYSTKHPPIAKAGRNLVLSVAGFGVSMVVFGLSKNFTLSMVALFFSGLTDGISMVIRGAILRILTPERLRGRVAAVNWIFIGSSNEIGALESGLAAKWFGTARSVWAGGCLTLLVVLGAWRGFPRLMNLELNSETEPLS